MPYRNTYGFPPYDPAKPMGGWDAETWQRYRQQQTYRAPNKTDRLALNKWRSDKKRQAAIAKIDATLARNPLGARPPAAPDNGNPALKGRKSRAQIRYDMAQERRARLQAERDRLAAELKRAPARAFSDAPGATPATAAQTTSAPANQVTAGDVTRRAPPVPNTIPTAYRDRAANTPPPNLPTASTPKAKAPPGTAVTVTLPVSRSTTAGARTPRAPSTPIIAATTTAALTRTANDPYLQQPPQKKRPPAAPTAIQTAVPRNLPFTQRGSNPETPKAKVVDQDREAARAKAQMASRLPKKKK